MTETRPVTYHTKFAIAPPCAKPAGHCKITLMQFVSEWETAIDDRGGYEDAGPPAANAYINAPAIFVSFGGLARSRRRAWSPEVTAHGLSALEASHGPGGGLGHLRSQLTAQARGTAKTAGDVSANRCKPTQPPPDFSYAGELERPLRPPIRQSVR